jgi:hypothetical protein
MVCKADTSQYNGNPAPNQTPIGSYGTAQCQDVYGNQSTATVNGLYVSAYADGQVGNYPGDTADNEATASLTYYFAVFPGPGNPAPIGSPVNIIVSSFLTATVPSYSGVSFATSSVTVIGQSDTTSCSASAGDPSYIGTVFVPEFDVCNFVVHDTVDVGYQYEIEISSFAESIRSESASSLADPYVQINPSTPNAGLYYLVFSDGIINAPVSMPEPDTLGLLLGFCGFGAIVRGRRKSSALAE